MLGFAGLATKAILFLLFFWWASRDPVGDAALQGVIAVDVLCLIVFGTIEWQFRRLAITWSFLFEILIVGIFLTRHSLFEIDQANLVGVSFAFGFPYLLVRTIIWSVEHAVETSGLHRDAMRL